MDNAARTRQRVLAIFLPVTAVLYISAEALSPKGTDQVISTTATALKVLPIAARHPAQLYLAGSFALLGLGGLAVSYAAIAALVAQRSGLVLVGPLVRNGRTGVMRRLLLGVAMARLWAVLSWGWCLPRLYAGWRPADFAGCRGRVVAGLRRAGYAKVFSRAARAGHDRAGVRLAGVSAPALVVWGGRDPGFGDRRAGADWVARVLRGGVVVPGAGHYPRWQRPGVTTGAVLRLLGSVQGRA